MCSLDESACKDTDSFKHFSTKETYFGKHGAYFMIKGAENRTFSVYRFICIRMPYSHCASLSG